jgi:hypothetical protein
MTYAAEWPSPCKPNFGVRISGEHRPLACSSRLLADCRRPPAVRVATAVRGKLPRTTGQRPVLPRTENSLALLKEHD